MPILVSDFDGTLTGRDYFQLILDHHEPPEAQAIWDGFKSGELTHFAAIAGVFAALRTDLAGAEALVREMDPPPGLGEAVQRLQKAGWELEIASAGCAWYIERYLAWQGFGAVLHACPGDFAPETGLVMRPAVDSPYSSDATGIDKAAVVRAALARDPVVAVAGDSGTDRAGVMLVPPERRFARRWLADELSEAGEAYREFEDWPEIVDTLLADATG